jgi:hypothetical protein
VGATILDFTPEGGVIVTDVDGSLLSKTRSGDENAAPATFATHASHWARSPPGPKSTKELAPGLAKKGTAPQLPTSARSLSRKCRAISSSVSNAARRSSQRRSLDDGSS